MLRKAGEEIVAVAQFKAKEGKDGELLEALHSLIPSTRAEEGNIRYELNQAIDDPSIITFIETFASQEALDFHRNAPYIRKFFDTVAPHLVETVVATFYKEILP